MSTSPVENLELRASEQRIDLHKSTAELKAKVANAREKLNVSKNAEHFISVLISVVALGLVSGYGLGGIFIRRCD